MRKLFGWVLHPVPWRVVGAACLSLVVWFGGPLVALAHWHPLEGAAARLVAIAALLALWLGRCAWRAARARLANRRLLAALSSPPPAAGEPPAGDQAMRQRFAEAVAALRDRRFGPQASFWARLSGAGSRRYLYELPWYAFIGAPGSGKTTALSRSGLRFALQNEVAGVGGTRHCDWWFADEAVLIDTAGRYTTQDSHQAADAAEWQAFLGQLKRHRPRQPLNGVLATVSVPDLLQADEAQRERQADAMRERIHELMRTLGERLPVYVLVTKCDLLAGFSESFEPMDRVQRDQPWGFTFDWSGQPSEGALDATRLDAEFDRLLQRLVEQSLDRMQAEPDARRRALVQALPWQLGALRPALTAFLRRALAGSQQGSAPIVRGVFFTSGTQEGTPIDRVLGVIGRSLGVHPHLIEPARPTGRSYFLRGLLEGVVFPEAPLAGTNQAWERRRARLKWAAALGGVLLGAAAAVAWTASYRANAAYAAAVDARARRLTQELPGRLGADASLPGLLPVLDEVRALARTEAVPDPHDAPRGHGYGLFQGEKLDAAARQAYRRLLQDALAPALAARMEQALRAPSATPEFRYETLKAYLMLLMPRRLDRETFQAWVDVSSSREGAGGALAAPQRERLLAHTEAMLAAGHAIAAPPRNEPLVAQARAALARAPLPHRVYDRLKRQGVGSEQPAFRVNTAAGPLASLVFVRTSGQRLDEGVPGLYTHDGYHKSFLKELPALVKRLADEESWVLGIEGSDNARRADSARGREGLESEVRRLYLQDYANLWERLVADIGLLPPANLAQSIQAARILSAPDSPLPPLLRAIVREVTLTEAPGPAKVAPGRAGESAAATAGGGTLAETRQKLAGLIGADAPAAAAGGQLPPLEAIVDERFAALRRLVKAPAAGQPAPLEQTLALIDDLYKALNATETAARAGAPAAQPELARFRADAARLPEPVKSMVLALAQAGAGQAGQRQREQVSALMKAAVGEPCLRATANRYPFRVGAANDVPLADFAQVFGPGGLLEAFFQKELAALADTAQKPWRLRDDGGKPDGGKSAALEQFQRAADIRGAFFTLGERTPVMRAQVRVLEMDAQIERLTLDADGQAIVFGAADTAPQPLQWPGPRGGGQLRLAAATAAGPGRPLVFEGPWALLRLVEAARIEPTGAPERLRAELRIDGRPVRLELVSASVHNPLRLAELREFRCPTQL